MTLAEVSKLSLAEKLQIMEAIWVDLRETVDHLEIPANHRTILDERKARIESGEAKVHDWDSVKHSIGRR